MIARFATTSHPPPYDNAWALEALKTIPGCRCCYHLYDPERDVGISLAIFENAQDIPAADEAVRARGREVGWQGPRPDEVRTYEVKGYMAQQ